MSAPAKESAPAIARAKGVADRAKEEVDALVTGFKQSSRFFQWKAYIIAAYAALLLVTLVVALWDTNELDAEIRVVSQPGFGGGKALAVTNTSDDDWTEVKFILNGAYTYKTPIATLKSGANQPLLVRDFEQVDKATNKRVPAPKDLVPARLAIECEEGSVELEFEQR